MRALVRFLTNLDAKAWRTAAMSFLLFGGVGVVFLFGAGALGLKGGGEAVERWLGAGLSGPWALAAAIGGFTVLAFLGVPQFVLVAAAVVAFGPWTGFLYSWIGNLVSSAVGFWVGRLWGAGLLKRYAGRGISDFIAMIGRNGFWASLVVRLVPSAPFVVVNMAAGATPMSVWGFVAGTAIGSVPKIALTAFAGQAVVKGLNGQGPGGGVGHWAWLALAAAVWLGSALAARVWLKRREAARLAAGQGGGAA